MSQSYSQEFQQYLQEPTIQQYFKTLLDQHNLSQDEAIQYIYQQWNDRKIQQHQQQQQMQGNQNNGHYQMDQQQAQAAQQAQQQQQQQNGQPMQQGQQQGQTQMGEQLTPDQQRQKQQLVEQIFKAYSGQVTRERIVSMPYNQLLNTYKTILTSIQGQQQPQPQQQQQGQQMTQQDMVCTNI